MNGTVLASGIFNWINLSTTKDTKILHRVHNVGAKYVSLAPSLWFLCEISFVSSVINSFLLRRAQSSCTKCTKMKDPEAGMLHLQSSCPYSLVRAWHAMPLRLERKKV